ncbi:MAG: hypothetical protein J0L82_10115 [Deltaproteobacteria bacterium]|jgi:hypothetical protein|nr:hypothetical protein [Deltaproteobacteria bacterium]
MNEVTCTPLRILNEPSGLLGLSSLDLCFLGYLLVVSHAALEQLGLGFLSFFVVALATYLLIAIRLRLRSKIIRDFFKTLILPKVIYDPET